MLRSALSPEMLFWAVPLTPPIPPPPTNLNLLSCARKTNKQKNPTCEFATSEHLVLLICTMLVSSVQKQHWEHSKFSCKAGWGQEGDNRAEGWAETLWLGLLSSQCLSNRFHCALADHSLEMPHPYTASASFYPASIVFLYRPGSFAHSFPPLTLLLTFMTLIPVTSSGSSTSPSPYDVGTLYKMTASEVSEPKDQHCWESLMKVLWYKSHSGKMSQDWGEMEN